MNDVICQARIKMSKANLFALPIVFISLLIPYIIPAKSEFINPDSEYLRLTGFQPYTNYYNMYEQTIYSTNRNHDMAYYGFRDAWIIVFLILVALVVWLILLILFYLASKKCSLSLYADRVVGTHKVMFTARSLNLPIDKIDSIMTSSGLTDKLFGKKSLYISTASGRMRFRAVHNADEFVAEALKTIEANKSSHPKDKETSSPTLSLDDLNKLKDLLDSGIITEEEFNAKKKQILGN